LKRVKTDLNFGVSYIKIGELFTEILRKNVSVSKKRLFFGKK